MDIYILRDGKETGPFSEETTQTLLKQGSILVNDPAWVPGMPAWKPLLQVLYPAATSKDISEEVGAEDVPIEPATPRQKVFLSYVGTPFSPTLTKEQAAMLVNEAMEDPKLHARIAQWTEDRLRMYPEIFSAEIQARKEDRPSHFLKICQVQGADRFIGTTKAHCKVLVDYLDVRFPNWDARGDEIGTHYFFAAIAEKFPQLVTKPWRGKLKFPDGLKVAPELVTPKPSPRKKIGAFLATAVVRGAVFGSSILLALYIGQQIMSEDTSLTANAGAAGLTPRQIAPAEEQRAETSSAETAPAVYQTVRTADIVPGAGKARQHGIAGGYRSWSGRHRK